MRSAAILILAVLAAGSAAAANKCVMPNGTIEYMDTACPADAKGSAVRTDRANSLDTSHSYRLHKLWGAEEECDAARETLSHKDSRANKEAMRRACGIAAPPPVQRTVCTGQSQAVAGGARLGTQNCVTK